MIINLKRKRTFTIPILWWSWKITFEFEDEIYIADEPECDPKPEVFGLPTTDEINEIMNKPTIGTRVKERQTEEKHKESTSRLETSDNSKDGD